MLHCFTLANAVMPQDYRLLSARHDKKIGQRRTLMRNTIVTSAAHNEVVTLAYVEKINGPHLRVYRALSDGEAVCCSERCECAICANGALNVDPVTVQLAPVCDSLHNDVFL